MEQFQLSHLGLTCLVCITLNACGSGSSSDSESADTAQISVSDSTDTSTDSSGSSDSSDSSGTSDNSENTSDNNTSPDPEAWVLNSQGTRSEHILESDTGLGVLVNVQSVQEQTTNGVAYTVVTSEGVPDYQVEMTAELVQSLNDRPKAGSDFNGGSTSANAGDMIAFGQDIGYASNNSCETNAGYGYWPPGPVCPEGSTRVGYFPQQPEQAAENCETGLGKVGLWVNGSSVYAWGDGQSYNNQGDWQTLAPVAEQYDVDICGGHAANGDYHHHFYSSCLADMVSDTASGHSPIYGYAADGYPIHGPWMAEGQLAISAWTVRDYSASATTGCDDGSRSCVMVDQYDVSQGTQSVSDGPGFSDIVTTLSGNQLTAFNGYYKEDYYWNSSLTEEGGAYLDQYNGHSHDDLGYHYHVTATQVDGKLSPSFPYTIGDKFAGELADNSLATCGGGAGGPPPMRAAQ